MPLADRIAGILGRAMTGLRHRRVGSYPQSSVSAMDESIRRLEELSDAAVYEFLRRSSTTYLEACIALMLTSMSVEEAAQILEGEAAHLRELG
jgi:hypothetical protein